MDTIASIVGFVAAFVLYHLAYKYFRKEKHPTCWLLVLLGTFILLCSFPWFQGFVKVWIDSKINSKLVSLGEQVNQVQATTGEMHGQLAKHQTEIDKHQKELDDVQSNIKNAQSEVSKQQTNIAGQYRQIVAVQNELATSQTNLNTQAKKIEDVEFLVNNLFSKTVTKTFSATDTNHVVVFSSESVTRLFLKLSNVPIKNSIQGIFKSSEFGQAPFIPDSWWQYKNIIEANMTGSWERWKNAEFTIQYVTDTRATNMVNNMEIRGNEIWFDNDTFGEWVEGQVNMYQIQRSP